MAKKKKEEMEFDVDSQNGKEYITPMSKFLQLSQLLFNEDSEECPYRMNELKKTNKFYDEAKKMAEELDIDWEKMTSEESNRIMLNLLGDAFMACKPQDDKGLHVKYTVTLEPFEKKKADKDEGGDNAGTSK